MIDKFGFTRSNAAVCLNGITTKNTRIPEGISYLDDSSGIERVCVSR